MAEIEKLSVGKALDKLRRPDAAPGRMERLDDEIAKSREEIRRMRATRYRLDRGQRSDPTVRDAQEADANRIPEPRTLGIIIVASIAIAASAWACWLLLKT